MLIEVLVASALSLVILTATFAMFVTSQKDATTVIAKADAVQNADVGLRQMVQDLDNAYQLEFPTSTVNTGCAATAGVQPCNIVDVLVRLSSSGFSGSDFEVRYDCTVASVTIPADRACWRYLCSASATTAAGSSCTAASGTLLNARLVIDDLINGTTSDPVFSLCYPSTVTTGVACGTGAARATSGTVTIKVPAAGTLSAAAGGGKTTTILTNGIYMANLDYNQ